MNANAYQPPKSDLGVDVRKPGSTFRAVLVGVLIELFGTLLVGLLIGVVFGFFMAAQGVSAEDIQAKFEQMDPFSSFALISNMAGFLVSLLAGYVCAWIANVNKYKPAYILAGISLSLGLLSGIGTTDWFTLLLLSLISAGAVLAGAKLHNRNFSSN